MAHSHHSFFYSRAILKACEHLARTNTFHRLEVAPQGGGGFKGCATEFSHMEKRAPILIVFIVIIAFVACYIWGVVRMSDERANEPLTYFMDGAVDDRV